MKHYLTISCTFNSRIKGKEESSSAPKGDDNYHMLITDVTNSTNHSRYSGPGVSLYLLHEDTGHP